MSGSDEQSKKQAARKKWNRKYYLKNRSRLIEAQKRRKRRLQGLPPLPTQKQLKQLEGLHRAARRRSAEWRELGWIVAKMNIEANLSQNEIYKLLGGMVSAAKIQGWCAYGKKLTKIKRPKPKDCA